jgi:HD-like signal output (HDOD) protein
MQELDDYINKVKHLPPAPVVLPQLLPLLNQPDIDCSRVAEVITYDQSLTAAVIQTCNSAYFAGRSPVEDIQEAIQRLGFREVYQIVLAVSGARVLGPAQKGYGIAEGELWRHAVCTAVAAQLMADDKGEDTSVVFTAALMHDVGKLVLAGALESIYAKVVGETELNQYSLLERKSFWACNMPRSAAGCWRAGNSRPTSSAPCGFTISPKPPNHTRGWPPMFISGT